MTDHITCPTCDGTGCSCTEIPVAERETDETVCCGDCGGSGEVQREIDICSIYWKATNAD